MRLNHRGLLFIQNREGLKLECYKCPANVITVGYGNVEYPRENNLKIGDSITQSLANRLFKKDIKQFENEVNKIVKYINHNQSCYNSLVSLCFNIGKTAFRNSTLRKCIVNGNLQTASEQFLVWNKIRLNGKLTRSEGLAKRRELEQQEFLRGLNGY